MNEPKLTDTIVTRDFTITVKVNNQLSTAYVEEEIRQAVNRKFTVLKVTKNGLETNFYYRFFPTLRLGLVQT